MLTAESLTASDIELLYSVEVPLLRRQGRQWRGGCPIHHGQDDNFAVNSETGQWFCHSQCATGGSVIDLVMQLHSIEFPEAMERIETLLGNPPPPPAQKQKKQSKEKKARGPIVRTYDYTDANGKLLFQECRHEPKDFSQRRPDGRGGWVWSMAGVELVPYNLPAVLAAKSVLVVEGPKDVETVRSLKLVGTTNALGALNWKPEYSETLRGKNVAIIEDNDEKGREHARKVAASLLGIANQIRIIRLPHLPEKGDLTDWVEAGGTREQLLQIIKDTPLIQSEADLPGYLPASEERDDPTPAPVDGTGVDVLGFDPHSLPESLRPLAMDISERMSVPADFPAAALVVALATAVGRRVRIQPKVHDWSWKITPNLWGAIVADPGFKKSPSMKAAFQPLERIQAQWRKQHEAALADYRTEEAIHAARLTAWKSRAANAAKSGAPIDPMPDEVAAPILRRLLMNDVNQEKAHEILAQNPGGVLMRRDELAGWIETLERAGREGERAFFLETWDGDESLTVDRIGRGTIHCEAACLSLFGSIQPGRLRAYITEVNQNTISNDGLFQRLQVLVWPNVNHHYPIIDRPPNAAAEQRVTGIFERLVIQPVNPPWCLRFDSRAQQVFEFWYTELETEVRRGDMPDALTSHVAKYRSLMPSLAGLFFLADTMSGKCQADAILLEHAEQAVRFTDYLKSHARRVYLQPGTDTLTSAKELARRILAGQVSDPFTVFEVKRRGWTMLTTNESIMQAIELLVAKHWLREVRSGSGELGGRPTIHYVINPKVKACKPN